MRAVAKRETYLQIWDAELVVDGEVVGPCGGCHHFVPRLLAGLLPRGGNQPKLCHVCRSGAARNFLKETWIMLMMVPLLDDPLLVIHRTVCLNREAIAIFVVL